MSQDYKTKDELGRNLFSTHCIQQSWCKIIKYAEDEYSTWDVAYLSGNTKIIGEIKYRGYDSTSFGDWYLQLDKLIKLQQIKQNRPEIQITYINLYKDNIIRIWDLSKVDIKRHKINKILLPKNSFEEEMVEKDVIYIESYDAYYKDEIDENLSIFKK